MRRNVFIAWNGDNIEVAKIVAEQLNEVGYLCTVGGGRSDSMFIETTVITQMNQCDLAIIIMEKRNISKNKYIFSENVMYEWGYLLAKLKNPQKIHPFIINAEHNELPSDILGAWKTAVTKKAVEGSREKEEEYNRVAKIIVDKFISDISREKTQNDKLIYLSGWDENKYDIFNYDGYRLLSEKLLFGMQASVYLNETNKLNKALLKIKTNNEDFSSVISCVTAMLEVFNKTNKLTDKIKMADYHDLMDNLNIEYENKISDKDLKAWCKILRNDKLELCHEIAANSFKDSKKYLKLAIKQARRVIELIDEQVKSNPDDINYANLYLAYQYRNLAQIYSALYAIDNNEAYLLNEKENREITFNIRKELRKYYQFTYGKDLFFDYINQEYILSAIEYYKFVDDENKVDLHDDISLLSSKWLEEINYKNFLNNQIKDKINDFFEGETND